MISLLAATASSAAFGASDFLGGLAARRATVLVATFWSFVGATVAGIAALALTPGVWSYSAIVAGCVAAAATIVGFLALYASMVSGSMGVAVSVVAAVEALVPVGFGVLAHHESFTMLGWLGIVLAIGGGVMLGGADSGAGNTSARHLILACIAGLGFGVSIVALDAAPAESGFIPVAFEVGVGAIAMGILLAFARVAWLGSALAKAGLHHAGAHLTRKALWTAAVSGVILTIANALMITALRAGSLAVVGVIISLYPIGTIGLARVFLKERLSVMQSVAIGAALLGCVVLALA